MVVETELKEVSQTQTSLRSLSPFEELLWLMDKRSPLDATLVAHVDGNTTVSAWRRGLDQARQRHPLWSAVIAVDECGSHNPLLRFLDQIESILAAGCDS